MTFPEDLRYTNEHEWIRLDDGGIATVGITDYAQGELGDVVFVELNEVEGGSEDVFGTVEAVKTVSDLYLPVSGTVVEINRALDAKPELVNSDPYGDGWMIKMKVDDPSEVEDLMSAEAYQSMIGA